MTKSYNPFRVMPKQLYIAKEGHFTIAVLLATALFMWIVGWGIFAFLSFAAAAFSAFFFRNPERTHSPESGTIISPADGKILSVTQGAAAPVTGELCTKISIFMSAFNVHVNRFPMEARVEDVKYIPGKFFVASMDKACEENERNIILLADDSSRKIVMVQIAGLVARRIVCYVKPGDKLRKGERFGMIKFGSRVDLYLPPCVEIAVKAGEKVLSGATIIGRFK